MTATATRIVERGYDAIAARFAVWQAEIADDPRDAWTQRLVALLPARARIVDLGCGGGLASTKALVDRGFEVTGVDISSEQLRLARQNVPGASFIHADFTELELAPRSVDAVTAFYSFNHVPRAGLGAMLERIATWFAPGGLLLAALGAGDSPDWTGEWLGTQMFFSSWDAATNRRLVGAAGLEILADEVATIREPDGDATFHWLLARR